MSRSIGGQFFPVLHSTMDTAAWRAMSHGARLLYLSLKRRVPRDRNIAFLSYRQAQAELRSSRRKIGEWFKELQYYGFTILEQHGSLGVDGKGKSPHWRLTELGTTSKTSSTGLPEPPTRDYQRWNGIRWKRPGDRRRVCDGRFRHPEKQNPSSYVGNDAVPTWETPPVPTWETTK